MATKKKSALGRDIPELDRSWEIEEDLRTLMRAEEIREDKARMMAVRKLAKEKLIDMAKISAMTGIEKEDGDKD